MSQVTVILHETTTEDRRQRFLEDHAAREGLELDPSVPVSKASPEFYTGVLSEETRRGWWAFTAECKPLANE